MQSDSSQRLLPNPITWEVAYERSRGVAFYILGDVGLAEAVAFEVAEALEVAYGVEKQRRKRDAPAGWYKVRPGKALMLDRLTHAKTSKHERAQEAEHLRGGRRLGERAMTVRFIKEIVARAFAHNSFYLLIGLYRILFNYCSEDAQRIYELLLQASNRLPDPAEYRRRKSNLMDRLTERFGHFVEVEAVGEQKEHRFRKREDAGGAMRLVEECLGVLTPLQPECPPLPAGFDPATSVLDVFRFDPSARKGEHPIERKRMHTLVHPPCFSRLLEMLRLPAPEGRLELPRFFLGGDDEPPAPYDPGDLPPLDAGRWEALADERRGRRRRRGRVPREEVLVLVDDVGQGVVRLDAPRPLALRVEEGAGFIEFRVGDAEGSLPLGIHLLEWGDVRGGSREVYRIPLKGGRKLRFEVAYTEDARGEVDGATVELSLTTERSLLWPTLLTATGLALTASAAYIYRRRRKGIGPQTSEP